MKRALVIFSGGQDSTTCLAWAVKKFDQVFAISFNYGQKHSVELHQAKKICEILNVEQTIVDISFLSQIAESELLKFNGDVNKINDKGLPSSFVPNRNQLFITLAHALAQKLKLDAIITGVCQTDYSGYPDCRQDFIDLIETATNVGSGSNIKILTPLMYLTKGEIFELANEYNALDLVLEQSHTCYNGNRILRQHYGYGCGECEACKLREKGYEEFLKKH